MPPQCLSDLAFQMQNEIAHNYATTTWVLSSIALNFIKSDYRESAKVTIWVIIDFNFLIIKKIHNQNTKIIENIIKTDYPKIESIIN